MRILLKWLSRTAVLMLTLTLFLMAGGLTPPAMADDPDYNQSDVDQFKIFLQQSNGTQTNAEILGWDVEDPASWNTDWKVNNNLVRWTTDTNNTAEGKRLQQISFVNDGDDSFLHGELILSGLPWLNTINCDNNALTKVSLSDLPRLTVVRCPDNQLTALEWSDCPILEWIICDGNRLTELDVAGLARLTYISCSDNQLTALDLSAVPALWRLYCSGNQLAVLDLSAVPELRELNCSGTQLTALDLSAVPKLNDLDCSGNQLTNLDLSAVSQLEVLDCSDNQLTALDLLAVPELLLLICSDNQLTALDLSAVPELQALDCSDNRLTALDLSGCNNLQILYFHNNSIHSDALVSLKAQMAALPEYYFTYTDETGQHISVARQDGLTVIITGINGVVFLNLYEDEIYLTPVPDEGYRFIGWTDLVGMTIPKKEDESDAETGEYRSQGYGTMWSGTALFLADDSDLIPPQVTSVTPNGTGVSLSVEHLTITFDQTMKAEILEGQADGSVILDHGATVSNPVWSEDRTTITYDLDGLEHSLTYTFAISGFWSSQGVLMLLDDSHNFTTEGEPTLTSPQVTKVTPNGSGVSLSVNQLTITFDQTMMAEQTDSTVELDHGATASNGVWGQDKKTITYDLSGLNYSTDYTVTIEGFRNAWEVLMEKGDSHTFTTAARTSSSSGGGGGSSASATLTVEGQDANGKVVYTKTEAATANIGKTVTVKAPAVTGYHLQDETEKTVAITKGTNKVVFRYVPISVLDQVNHLQYLYGYPDQSVRPEGNITRAEAAVIFYRLIADENKDRSLKTSFRDVESGAWYYQELAYLEAHQIISSYSDGTFRPNQAITRAEFTMMAACFYTLETNIKNSFTDISDGHEAVAYINNAVAKGWIDGFPDGSFRPEDSLTRAQMVTLVNRVLNRKIELADIPEGVPQYMDLAPSDWSYCDIIEASIGHDYTRKADGYEIWTSVNP